MEYILASTTTYNTSCSEILDMIKEIVEDTASSKLDTTLNVLKKLDSHGEPDVSIFKVGKDQASTLADIPPRTETHSSAASRRVYTQ